MPLPSSACSTSPRATCDHGASIERIAGRRVAVASGPLSASKQGEPGILIAGHLDTVHPIGTLETNCMRREGNKCFGPGSST